jgi:WD40 repeat protein
MTMRRALIGLAVLLLACGAQTGASPASAEPKPKSKKRAAVVRAPGPISGHNADRVQKLWEAAAGGRARAVALDAAQGRVAYAAEDGVRAYELSSGKLIGSLKPCPEVLQRGMAFFAGKLIVGCERSVEQLELKRLKKLGPVAVHNSKITAATVSGSRLALGHNDGVVRIYALDGSRKIEIAVPGPPIDVKSLALSRDGSRIAVAWIQGSIWWWNTAKPDEPHKLVRHDTESDSLAWSRDGSLLAEEGAKQQTTIWTFGAAAPKETFKLKNGAWVKQLAFSLDGKWLARGGSDGLELAEIAGPRRVALDTRGSVEDVALDERGALIAAADRDGRLSVWAAR